MSINVVFCGRLYFLVQIDGSPGYNLRAAMSNPLSTGCLLPSWRFCAAQFRFCCSNSIYSTYWQPALFW